MSLVSVVTEGLTSLITKLQSVVDALAGGVSVEVSNLPATQPVSATALPLPAGAATDDTLANGVGLRADLRSGAASSGVYTLSATPGTITTINIPDGALYAVLEALTVECRAALNENPAAAGSGALATGIRLRAATEQAIILQSGTGRTLRLRSATASAQVHVEFR